MTRSIFTSLLFGLLIGFAGCATQRTELTSVTSSATDDDSANGSVLYTFWSNDPITHALSLADGLPGGMFQDHQVKNRDSYIEFDHYQADGFTVGIQGGDKGCIVDLGEETNFAARYGVKETV